MSGVLSGATFAALLWTSLATAEGPAATRVVAAVTPPLAAQYVSADASEESDEIRVEVIDSGSSFRRVRRTATEELPLDRLSPEARRQANNVLNSVSLFRRLPVVDCQADRRVLDYFLQHPDVAVGIWRALEITEMQLKSAGEGRYTSDSGDGTTGVITVLYSDQKQYLVLCEGLFKSPVLARPIQASALMHLQSAAAPAGAGQGRLRCRADIFVSFPSTTVETAVRVISPVSNRIADKNFEEVAMFIRMMHLAMTRQPGWVEQISTRLPEVSHASRESLLDLTATVYVEAQRGDAQQGQVHLTPEGLRLPIRREPEVEGAASATGGIRPPVSAGQSPSTLSR